jgi:uncharacterized membrane protein YhaH (DUF805 family)
VAAGVPDRRGCLAWAVLPLRRYAEFGGRSTRTELIAFYLLFMLIMAIGISSSLFVPVLRSAGMAVVGWLLLLVLLCPSVALAVRRLHDSGRSGGWALLALPAHVLNFMDDFYTGPPLDSDGMAALADLGGLAGLASLVLLVLLLWNDDPEPNRYGPNPRMDAREPEIQDLA